MINDKSWIAQEEKEVSKWKPEQFQMFGKVETYAMSACGSNDESVQSEIDE